MALCGFPFLAGFYSRDLILELIIGFDLGLGLSMLIFFVTLLTAIYRIRLIFNLFFSPLSSSVEIGLIEGLTTRVPIALIFIGAVTGGALLVWGIFPVYIIILPSFFRVLVIIIILLYGLFFSISINFGIAKHIFRFGPIIGLWSRFLGII